MDARQALDALDAEESAWPVIDALGRWATLRNDLVIIESADDERRVTPETFVRTERGRMWRLATAEDMQ